MVLILTILAGGIEKGSQYRLPGRYKVVEQPTDGEVSR